MALPLKRNRKFVFVLSLRPQTCNGMEAFIEKFSRKYNLPAADCLRLIGLMERRVFRKGSASSVRASGIPISTS